MKERENLVVLSQVNSKIAPKVFELMLLGAREGEKSLLFKSEQEMPKVLWKGQRIGIYLCDLVKEPL